MTIRPLIAETAVPCYDLILRGGTLYDGSGRAPIKADLAIHTDKIAAIGNLDRSICSKRTLDVTGLAVAPGFINMLSWATESLLLDGRSQSNIRQGVTLEVFGEGQSMGPLNAAMQRQLRDTLATRWQDPSLTRQPGLPWTTLAGYLEFLVAKGVSPNIASFVGATTVRIHELGYVNRQPSSDELKAMQALVAKAMQAGALGVGSSLIYAPGFYAQTSELIALAQTAAAYDGLYISHLRSEGSQLLESIDELIQISEQSGARAEIYHLKVAGRKNWSKHDAVVAKIASAHKRGLAISANMYVYRAGSTGLDAAMPPWVQEGGFAAWVNRLGDPEIRAKLITDMTTPGDSWENLLLAAGPKHTLLIGFQNPRLRQYTGKTLAEVAQLWGVTPQEAAMDLVIADRSRVQALYFLMSENNIAKTVQLPWVSFGSDAPSIAAEGLFLERGVHPRTYGNFARLVARYVRDKNVLQLETAIQKMTQLPATNLKIKRRGALKTGYYADIAVFDPTSFTDHATYAAPHQYATGMVHVFVNGKQVLDAGQHTGRLPGRVVRGPGWSGWTEESKNDRR